MSTENKTMENNNPTSVIDTDETELDIVIEWAKIRYVGP